MSRTIAVHVRYKSLYTFYRPLQKNNVKWPSSLKKRPVFSQSRNTTRARSLIKSHFLSTKSGVGEVNSRSLSTSKSDKNVRSASALRMMMMMMTTKTTTTMMMMMMMTEITGGFFPISFQVSRHHAEAYRRKILIPVKNVTNSVPRLPHFQICTRSFSKPVVRTNWK